MTGALQMRQRHHHEQIADMETGRGGIEPDVSGDRSCGQRVADSFGCVVHQSAPRQLAIDVHQPLLYNPRMGLTRRAALKGVLATTVGAITGAAVYGVGYERHHLGITEVALDVSGLPLALDGLRIGFLTDIHHSAMVPADDVVAAVALTLSTNSDLIVLGGDYVTWGDRDY